LLPHVYLPAGFKDYIGMDTFLKMKYSQKKDESMKENIIDNIGSQRITRDNDDIRDLSRLLPIPYA